MKTIKAKMILSITDDMTQEEAEAHIADLLANKEATEKDIAHDAGADSVELLEVWVE